MSKHDIASRVKVRGFGGEEDLRAWVDIHNQPSVVFGTLRIPYTPEAFWARRFDSGNTERVLLAEVDGRVVAGAGFHIGRNRMVRTGSFGMGVDEDFQGQGIGSALMAAIVDLADNWYNLRRIELEVFADNLAGVALYKKFGFEVEGLYRKYAYRDGEYVDALPMARLRPDPWHERE